MRYSEGTFKLYKIRKYFPVFLKFFGLYRQAIAQKPSFVATNKNRNFHLKTNYKTPRKTTLKNSFIWVLQSPRKPIAKSYEVSFY